MNIKKQRDRFIIPMSSEKNKLVSPPKAFPGNVGSPLRRGSTSADSPLKRFSSPSGRFNTVHDGDRFIPNRLFSNLEDALESNLNSSTSGGSLDGSSPCENKEYFNYLLRSELLGASSANMSDRHLLGSITKSSLFKYNSNSSASNSRNSFSPDSINSNIDGMDGSNSNMSMLSPNRLSRGGSISSPQNPPKPSRKISKSPYKILDAPALEDDFYLNLLDWSSTNFLAIGLGKVVFTWSACTSQVTELHNFEDCGSVTSISWSNKGDLLAVGCSDGSVSIWDPFKLVKIREFRDHSVRVGVTAWSSNLLATGSRDRNILVHDLRIKSNNDGGRGNSTSRQGGGNFGLESSGRSDRSSDMFDSDMSMLSSSHASIQPTANNIRATVSVGLSSPLSSAVDGSESDIHFTSVQDSSSTSNEFVSDATSSSAATGETSHILDSIDAASDGNSIFSSTFAPVSAYNSSRQFQSNSGNRNSSSSSSSGSNYGNSFSSSLPASSSESHRDPSIVFDFRGHKQEVCGLKWSFDEKYIASGGNDNKLLIWNVAHGHSNTTTAGNILSRQQNRTNSPPRSSESSTLLTDYLDSTDTSVSQLTNRSSSGTYPHLSSNPSAPMYQFDDHLAAVKAVAWSPHQSGLLASGGGTADRHIRFWNVLNGTPLTSIDTGSQVCNLVWSKTVNEFVSTHGYSLNQIIVWKYPSLQKMAILTGHTFRVLYLGMSPDGQTVVTGAGDETLRFWNIFPPSKHGSGMKVGSNIILSSANMDIR